MNKLNNIFKKIAELEKNANEIKLAKHEVELSDYVDVVSSFTQLEKNYNTILKESAIARTTLKKAVELIQQQQVLTNNFNENIINFDKKAKDLGIDWKTAMPEFVKYQTAVSKQYAPQNLKDIVDAYNNL